MKVRPRLLSGSPTHGRHESKLQAGQFNRSETIPPGREHIQGDLGDCITSSPEVVVDGVFESADQGGCESTKPCVEGARKVPCKICEENSGDSVDMGTDSELEGSGTVT